jgi:uridine kinase
LIGIAGPSGSGKTELARRLAPRLGADTALLSLDSYYRDLSALEPAARAAHNFDHPDSLDRRLLAEQVAALGESEPIEVPVYDFATHTRTAAAKSINPGSFVLVEGLFVLCWEEVRTSLDLKLFIDASHEICLARRIARDVRERGRTERSVREQYERTVRPMFERYVRPTRSHADLVVDDCMPVQKIVEQVLAAVDSRQGER